MLGWRERAAAALPVLSLVALVAGMVAAVYSRHLLLVLAGVVAMLALLGLYLLVRGPDPQEAAARLAAGSVLYAAPSLVDAVSEEARSSVDGPAAGAGGLVGVRRPQAVLVVPGAGRRARVATLAYHPQGQVLVVGGQDGRVHFWDAAALDGQDSRPVSALAHSGGVTAVAFSPDGRWLATAGPAGVVRVWDATGPGCSGPVATVGHPGRGKGRAVQCVDVGPGGWLVAGARDGTVAVWDPVPGLTGGVRFQLTARCVVARWPAWAYRGLAGVLAVRFAPGGGLLAAGGSTIGAAAARVWPVPGPGAFPSGTGAKLRPHAMNLWCGNGLSCHALAFHPTAPVLVTASTYDYAVCTGSIVVGGGHSAVVIWDLADLDRPKALATLNEAACTSDKRGSGRPEWVSPLVLVGHAAPVRCVAIDPHGRWLATGGDDKAVMLWDLTAPSRPVHWETFTVDRPVRALAFAPDRPRLACLAGYHEVLTWDLT